MELKGAMRQRSMRSEQRGVALITVLLVFALVAVIAAEMLHRSQLNLRSVGNLVETRQAYYYALGGEAYARQVLAKDILDGHGNVDTLTEPWAQTREQQPFEIDNGQMQIEIDDLQARFNLNSLVNDSGTALQAFVRLLNALQLNPNYAYEWKDWVDRDTARSANGAEDAEYEGYLTPGGAEADISALRLLHSMQPQDYAKLAPHVTVLPSADSESGGSQININTADDAVLRALSPTLDVAQVLAKQKSGGYRDLNQLPAVSSDAATVKSSFFEVVVTVSYANRWQRVRTVLQRISEGPNQIEFKVISRVRSPLVDDIEL